MKYFLLIFLLLTGAIKLDAQCGCPGSAPVNIPPAVGGTTDAGTAGTGRLRLSAFTRYGYADKYFIGDSRQSLGPIKNSSALYSGILAGYGLTKRLTLEGELGYFINKRNIYTGSEFTSDGKGLSSGVISAKYNVYSSDETAFEYTAGAGIRLPFSTTYSDTTVSQYLHPSSGAVGLVLHSFMHKDFYRQHFHFFLLNRFEWNAENKYHYQYGSTLFTSMYFTKLLLQNLTGIVELRHEWRGIDRKYNSVLDSTGSSVFVVSPQVNYNILENLNISAIFDYPFYQYYRGEQMGSNYSFALSLSWWGNLLNKE